MTIRPVEGTEELYCYRNSQQISAQTGLIGHLRADFGRTGKEFYSSFFDFREDLKSPDFKAELDIVVNELRDGFLKDREQLSAFCGEHPESLMESGRQYGFRADTDHYSYLLWLNPDKGDSISIATVMSGNGWTGTLVTPRLAFDSLPQL